MDPTLFRSIAGHWLSGVAVVTAMDTAIGLPCGMTMSAVTSLSLEPPQFLICIDHRARTLRSIQTSGHFCINYLNEDQELIAAAFSQPSDNRFASVTYHPGQSGAPVLDGVIAFVECKVHSVHPGGDHCIVIGDAIYGGASSGRPLGYFRGAYRRLGS
jgi:flavin reductase (DIM6/NTAB) family NADH-FMN oxidoreductase RutF